MRSERRGILKCLLFAVLLTVLAFVSGGGVSAATTYYVNPGESIQAAVTAADPGDSIIVRDGIYTENVEVNVPNLTLRSEHGATFTILHAANTSDHVLEVIANAVTITGFTVVNATASDTAGIFVNGVERCMISENTATGNDIGIQLLSSPYNMLLSNRASMNKNGIYLHNSNENTLTGNVMFNNTYNFCVYSGYQLEHFIQEIDTSNTVDGKPIYYWVNQHDQAIPADAGFVGIVNSTNISVRGVTVTNSYYGVLLAYTTNSTIENSVLAQNRDGIILSSAINNTITNNTITEGITGIYLYNSDRNRILKNNTISAFYRGIMLQYADHNTIERNNISNNGYRGIHVYDSDENSINDNEIMRNYEGIYLSSSSNNNTLTNNTASNNYYDGIRLDASSNNTLTGNTASSNNQYGIRLFNSSVNLIYNNYFDNTQNAYDNGLNIWNITKTPGTNIIGGSYLGGNYWSDYAGEDTDDDGLGNTALPYNSVGGIQNGGDWLPLVKAGAPPGRWDINEDCTVNFIDLAILSAHWLETTTAPFPRYDINKDGVVNFIDLTILSAHWLETTC